MRKHRIPLLAAVYFAFLFVHAVCAQTANATLTGKVTAAGAGLPKAAVTVTEANTGASRKVLTGPDGTFSVSGLAPGTYRIEVDTPGYRRGILERYELAAAPSAPLEVTLERGSSTDPTQVRVESETPMVQSDSAEVAQVHSTKMVSELPVADRNREQLVELMPGITPPAPAVSPLLDAQGSRSYNTNGQLSMANHRSLDGTENQEPFFGLTLHAVPNEFVRQARIVTANENAALGRLGGAQESVTTCLGTNNIHGSLFEFNSFNWLRARNVFNTLPNPRPRLTFNQFGADFGAPIIKDHTFFYGSYEGMFLREQKTEFTTVPTAAFRAGNFTAPPDLMLFNPFTGNTATGTGRARFANNMIGPGLISPQARALLPFIPLPNRAGLENNFVANVPFRDDNHRFDGRMDHRLSEKAWVFLRYGYSRYFVADASPLGAIGAGGESRLRTQSAAIGLTYSFDPNLQTQAHFSYGRYRDRINALNVFAPTALGIANLPAAALPSIQIAGMAQIGPPANFPFNGTDNIFQLANTWTANYYRHNVTFGVDIWRIRADGFANPRFGPQGGFTFNPGVTALPGANSLGASGFFPASFAAFLLGEPATSGVSVITQSPSYRTTYYSGFISDRVKLTSRLMVDVGLRYDIFSPLQPSRAGGAFIYDPSLNILRAVGINPVNMRGNVKYDFDNIGPRFGFAYSLTKRTVVRGGYSLMYYPGTIAFFGGPLIPPSATIERGVTGSFAAGGALASAPAIPVPPALSGGVISPAPNQAFIVGAHAPETPYVQNFNLTVQQDLGYGAMLGIGYVGTLGRQLPFNREINAALPGAGVAGLPLNAAFGRTASTIERTTGLNNNYNSLQVDLKKRMGHGLSLTGAYTYAKALDYASDPFRPLAGTNTRANYGPADYDRKHIFTLGHVLEIPVGAGSSRVNSGLFGQVLGGWTLNGIFTWAEGTPFSVLAFPAFAGAPNNATVFANVLGSPAAVGSFAFNAAAFAAPAANTFGNAGRNAVRGPGYTNYDLALFKSFGVREKARVELRGEAYNLFNTPRFANPMNIFNSANFGRVTNTLNGAGEREVHLGARVVF